MTQDDAGKRVPLVRFNVTNLPLSVGPLPKPVQRAMRRAVAKEAFDPRVLLSLQASLRWGFLGLSWPLLLFGGFALLRYGGLLPHSPLALIALPLLMMPVALLLVLIVTPMAFTDKERRACATAAARAGHCGSCGYPFPPSLTHHPRLHTGPECGAAWTRSARTPQQIS